MIAAERKRAGRFILETNLLDSQQLTSDDILLKYKEQQARLARVRFSERPVIFRR